MHVFKHPKYYKELRERNKLDQAISKEPATAGNQRSPDPGPKASSSKPQAASVKHQACEASSGKHQAPGKEAQASSRKQQAP